ncbi:MAG TPA: helix-turn-helix domain-containing protein [Candidatus Tectomicrobia bacterium]|nr:helix-turn-helix domain-containing protein [Candidatus Tectomicrobia bacterium]
MDKVIDMKRLGRRLAGKRVERGLTQQELATRAHLTQRTIALLELGNKPGVALQTMASLAHALQVCLTYLVYGDEDDEDERPTRRRVRRSAGDVDDADAHAA